MSVSPALPADAPAPAMSAGLIALLLALFLGIQPVTTDLYLPALPTLVADLHAGMGQAQLTLSALLLCFGLSQLVFGPLSDRFGRRPVLIGGLLLYTLAGLGNALAPNIEWLIATRAVQGAAMGAVVMCARAIIRDLYAPHQGARIMARALGGLGVIACISPLLGGVLVPLVGWRWALTSLALFGALTLALVARRFRESLARPDRQALQPARMAANWLAVARHPTFLAWALLQTSSFAALFVFLAASSFVYLEIYGMTRPQYGAAVASASLAYVAGTLLCQRWLPRIGLRGAVRRAAWLTLSGGTIMGLLAWAGIHSWWAFVLPHYLFMFAHGIHQPCSQTGSVGPFPEKAGTASALSGFMLTVVAFGISVWLGHRLDGTVYPMVNGVWLWSVLIALISWTLVQRHGAAGDASRSAGP